MIGELGGRLIRRSMETLAGGLELAANTAETAAGLAALARSGVLRPPSPQGAVEIAQEIRRAGAKPYLIYTLNARRDPYKAALIFQNRVTSWRELDERTIRLANHFLDRGLRPGDAITIMLPNRPEFLEAQAAALRIGAATSYVNPRAPADDARALVERSKAKLLVTHRPEVGESLVDVLEAGEPFADAVSSGALRPPEVPKDAQSTVVIFTSGTTGRPKGAVRSLDGSVAEFGNLLRLIPYRHTDVHMVVCPLYHSSGSGFAAMAQGLSNPLVLVERFSPQAFCEHVERHRVTTTTVVPTMLHQLCEWPEASDYDLSSLRIVVCTGAPLRADVRERSRELLGDVLYDLYGSTEMGWVSVATPDDQRRYPETVGRPVPGVDVRITDPDGRPLPPGEVGEVWTRSEALMERYLDDPELDRERMRDGYVSVKDVGFLDREGYLHVVDRADDMIISGGVNVYPAEVEVALSAHPEVSTCAVVGVPDPRWGQRIVAQVVRRGDVSSGELVDWCKEHASYAAVPKEIRFADDLPRNDVGKVDKRAIVESWS